MPRNELRGGGDEDGLTDNSSIPPLDGLLSSHSANPVDNCVSHSLGEVDTHKGQDKQQADDEDNPEDTNGLVIFSFGCLRYTELGCWRVAR